MLTLVLKQWEINKIETYEIWARGFFISLFKNYSFIVLWLKSGHIGYIWAELFLMMYGKNLCQPH